MKKTKILCLMLSILLVITSFIILQPQCVVKADSNSDKINRVGLVGSSDWSTSTMPDYNRFMSNATPFYNSNTVSNIYLEYFFTFEAFKPDDTDEYFVLLSYYDYYFSNASDAQSAYDYLRQLPSNASFSILDLNYYERVWFYTYCFLIVNIDDLRVTLRVCCRAGNIHFNSNGLDKSSMSLIYSFSNNSYNYCFTGLFLEKSDPNIYVFFHDVNKPYSVSANGDVNYTDCWGFSSFRNDYFKIKYDVFSYYYFNYGDIERPVTNCWWCDGVRLTFNSSNIDNIILIPTITDTSTAYGWYADTGLIIDKVDFQTVGRWISYVNNNISYNYYYQMSFNYYVKDNLINSFVGSNTDYNSTSLYKQDVQWYDVFGHLYNFMIYLLFDMPLISNITKPIYMLISSTTTTFNWLAGCVAGLGVFGAFAMVYLLFAIIKRML